MPFDLAGFERAKFEARRGRVPVPALAQWFSDGEAAEWEVRGLNSSELHRAMEAAKRQHNIETVVRAIASGGDQAEAVRKAIGLVADTPGEIAKRLEMLVMGSITPKVELPIAVKLAESFPVEFLLITNEITELTGRGFDLVKPAAASQPTTA
jgi:hypothetical protein